MMQHVHLVVWIDHQAARLVALEGEAAVWRKVSSTRRHQHLHHKANESGSGHVGIDTDYLERVAQALEGYSRVLLTGPAGAKLELMSHLERRHPRFASCIVGIEPTDHLSDGELVAFGRRFFHMNDRMHSPVAARR